MQNVLKLLTDKNLEKNQVIKKQNFKLIKT